MPFPFQLIASRGITRVISRPDDTADGAELYLYEIIEIISDLSVHSLFQVEIISIFINKTGQITFQDNLFYHSMIIIS